MTKDYQIWHAAREGRLRSLGAEVAHWAVQALPRPGTHGPHGTGARHVERVRRLLQRIQPPAICKSPALPSACVTVTWDPRGPKPPAQPPRFCTRSALPSACVTVTGDPCGTKAAHSATRFCTRPALPSAFVTVTGDPRGPKPAAQLPPASVLAQHYPQLILVIFPSFPQLVLQSQGTHVEQRQRIQASPSSRAWH